MIKITYPYEVRTLALGVDGERIHITMSDRFDLSGSFSLDVPKRLRGSFQPGQQVYVTISTEKPTEGVETPEGEQG